MGKNEKKWKKIMMRESCVPFNLTIIEEICWWIILWEAYNAHFYLLNVASNLFIPENCITHISHRWLNLPRISVRIYMHYTVGRKTDDFVTLQSFFHCAEGGGNISLWGTKPSTLNCFP